MVSCKLYGRLGNQLFQIAATIAYSIKYKMEYSIPEKTLDPKVWPAYFEGLLPYKPLTNGMYAIYKEPSHSYAPLPPYVNVMLEGYFQSYRYFDFCFEQVREQLGFDWEFDRGMVSIHVRRGDYLNHPDKHPVVSNAYLYTAIEMMINQGYNKFYFFSDDIPWCKVFPKPERGEYAYSNSNNPIQDLMEMSCCEHNIISNSSFSWWAAMLNQNQNKIVITPDESNWFGFANKHLDVSELIPLSWRRIKY